MFNKLFKRFMTDENTNAPEESQAEEVKTPGNQVPAGAQVPGVDVTTGKPDGLTDAEPEAEQVAPPEAPQTPDPTVEPPVTGTPAEGENTSPGDPPSQTPG